MYSEMIKLECELNLNKERQGYVVISVTIKVTNFMLGINVLANNDNI